MEYLVVLLAFVWGGIWAAFIQFVPLGRFLARRRTWITVVIGVGVDLAIMKLIIPWDYWKWVGLVIGASSVAIITRSLINEWGEWMELFDVIKDAAGQ